MGSFFCCIFEVQIYGEKLKANYGVYFINYELEIV